MLRADVVDPTPQLLDRGRERRELGGEIGQAPGHACTGRLEALGSAGELGSQRLDFAAQLPPFRLADAVELVEPRRGGVERGPQLVDGPLQPAALLRLGGLVDDGLVRAAEPPLRIGRRRRAQLLEVGPLVGQGARQLEPREASLRDEDLAEPLPRLLLDSERMLELFLVDRALLHEDLADRPPAALARVERRPFRGDSGQIGLGGVLVLLRLLLECARPLERGPLVCERAREIEPRDAVARDEDLAEPHPGPLLLFERALQVVLGDETFLDEDRPDQACGNRRCFHIPLIGSPSDEV